MEQNTFVRGLITEASPLTYPENASLSEENFVLNRDGSRQRRLGIDFEDNRANTTVSYTEGSNGDIEHFLWKNAGNVQNVDISVLKVGSVFYFFDNNAEAVSGTPLNGGTPIGIAGFDPTGSGNPVIYSYAFINGKMIVASGYQNISILSYDEATDNITVDNSHISIRDTFGIFDDREVDDRPNFAYTLDASVPPVATFNNVVTSGIHIYNLSNQGWQDDIRTIWGSVAKLDNSDSIAQAMLPDNATFDGLGLMPSNSDVISDNLASGHADPTFNNLFHPRELKSPLYGTRKASKGHTLFDNMFDRGTDRARIVLDRSGKNADTSFVNPVASATLPSPYSTEATEGGLSAVTAYSGRLIYAVIENGRTNPDEESPSFGDMIFYSQITDGTAGLTRCYTDIDPTNPEDFALLDTDGGYITLSDVGTINSFEVLGSSLFVFADNGVWQVNGGNSLFTPSNTNVHRITNVGNINKKGIVVSENRLFYLSDAGLYEVTLSDVDPSLPASVTNISQTTIQAFFDVLTIEDKSRSVSTYDRFSNQIKWLFAVGDLPDGSYYDTELILDLNLNAFSVNKIKSVTALTGDTPYVIGYLERPSAITVDTTQQIVRSGDNVIVGADNVKITFRSIDSSVLTSNKYWVSTKNSPTKLDISVAEHKDLQFRDWGSVANTASGFGEDAYAFLLTGYLTGGDSSTNKRITYITTHFRRTERIFTAVVDGFEPDNPSSCILTGQWEWTSSVNAGRWSNPQQIYRLPRTFIPDVGTFDYGHEVVTTKNKLRGKGKALSLLFQTEPLKDCHLYGWSYELNAEVSV